MLGDASACKELGGLVREVVAVVVEQVIPIEKYSFIDEIHKWQHFLTGHAND